MSEDGLICANCGTGNPAAARFCNQCGARLGAPATYTPPHLRETLAQSAGVHGERKLVTVLFADIKGSTRLAEQAGAERWHEVLDRFFGILTRAIHDYQGTVNQYTGDGIMALFGAPRALEDHAQLAAHAALEMQREVRRYADDLRLRHGLNLSMRVGLNSGEAIVGRIGDGLRSDYTAQGPTVNLAARMEKLCEPGRIYAARDTAALLEGHFRLRALGATEVAGVAEAIEVFEVEGTDGLRTRLDRSLARVGSPFVGRGTELARLVAALERVKAGEGQVVAVIGNAGIGKSRLCYEFTTACARDGIAVHRASGVPYASRVPMFPMRQLLRSKLGVPSTATAQEARRWVGGALLLEDAANAALLPHVFDFLGIADTAQRTVEDGAPMQARMLEQLAEYLPCGEGAVVLLIEDLHFLDPASEAFLPQLCAAVRGHRCLLLLNYRPDYVSEWLQPQVDESVSLSALGEKELQQLALVLLGEDPSMREVADAILQRAAGNPYFVEEAVLSLAQGGWLEGRPRAWRLARPVEEWPVPDSVQALLAARIDRLPEPLRRRLHTAAVVGQEFDHALLEALDGTRAASVNADLDALEELGFVYHRDSGEAAFCHPLMQEVAYRAQLESQRRAVHARLAELLELRHGGHEATPQALSVRIAHHWQAAGQWLNAGRWNLVAHRWALSQNIALTTDQLRRALANYDRAPAGPEAHRGRIAARAALIRLAQFAPVSHAEVERVYAEARTMATECGDVACEAELLISYGNELLHRGDVDGAAGVIEEAVRLCFDHGQHGLINRFRLALLMAFSSAGHLRRALEVLDAAGGDWRTRPVDQENYLSRGLYGLMLGWLGRLDEAVQHLGAALDFTQRESRSASWMYANRVDLAVLSGDYALALPAAREGLQRAEEFGSAFFRAVAMRAYATALTLENRAEEALEVLREAAPLFESGANAHQFEAQHLAAQAQALLLAVREADAETAARAARASACRAGSRIWEMVAWLVWLRLPPAPGRAEEAQEGLRRVETLIDFCGAEGFRPWLHLARLHWNRDESERARELALARSAFELIGAGGHLERLAGRAAGSAAVVREWFRSAV